MPAGYLPGCSGWAQIIPDSGTSTPAGAGVFSYSQGGILVTQSGIPSATPTTHAHVYVDMTGQHNTGLAIANPSGVALNVSVTAFQPDGVTRAGSGSVSLVPLGHAAKFAGQFISGLPRGFTGVLDVSAPQPFVALTLRSLQNSRGDFLLTTMPIADLNQTPPSPLVFPQIADSGGYQTQIILLGTAASSTVAVNYSGNDGAPMIVEGTLPSDPYFSPGFVAKRCRQAWIQDAWATTRVMGLNNPTGLLPALKWIWASAQTQS